MSATPVSHAQHPPHGHPDNTAASTQAADKPSTASHPPSDKPDPTTGHAAQGGLAAANASSPAELSRLKVNLRSALRQFPDFPSPGILFEDIMPIFANHALFTDLVRALELQVASVFNTTVGQNSGIDVVVGLESRGFLFGPTLALRLGAGFVPVRKQGKLPGNCVTEGYQKEYGTDHFQVQEDAIKPGQKVIIVDDIIATGGSAAAAGSLVRKLGGDLVGFLFMMELDFLQGRAKLDAPVHTLLSGQEESLEASKEKFPASN
ncbi:hypothetical protein Q7P37_004466 [Cladosporium fusiforme]